MFQSPQSLTVAPTKTVGSNVRSVSRRSPAPSRWLGTLPLALLSLAVMGKPTLANPTVTVMPGSMGGYTKGMPVAVISATDTSGDPAAARHALDAANAAISHWPGYVAISPRAVAGALSKLNLHGDLVAPDYQNIGKRLKAQRMIAITLTPGNDNTSYTALAEMYDTTNGSLVGRGQAPFTATPGTGNAAPTPDGLRDRSIDGAVAAAIAALDETATLHGIVISLPGAYQARLSLGERQGIRNGARIEYLVDGQPVAYGTVFDVGAGEALASIASEAAMPSVMLDTEFRTVSNPTLARAGLTARQVDDKNWKKFERDFIIGAIPALAYQYYLYGF